MVTFTVDPSYDNFIILFGVIVPGGVILFKFINRILKIYESAKRTVLEAPPQIAVGVMVNETVSCFDGLETIGAIIENLYFS